MTEAARFTPGPWRECKAGQCTCGMIWSIPGDFPVCTAAGGSTFPVAVAHEHMADAPDMIYASISPEAVVANARLIAAAPDLLAALKEVREWISNWSPNFEQDDEWPDTARRMREAIAKATTT